MNRSAKPRKRPSTRNTQKHRPGPSGQLFSIGLVIWNRMVLLSDGMEKKVGYLTFWPCQTWLLASAWLGSGWSNWSQLITAVLGAHWSVLQLVINYAVHWCSGMIHKDLELNSYCDICSYWGIYFRACLLSPRVLKYYGTKLMCFPPL